MYEVNRGINRRVHENRLFGPTLQDRVRGTETNRVTIMKAGIQH